MKARITVSTIIALVLLAGIFMMVAVVPFLPGYDPYTQNLAASLVMPGQTSFDGHFYLFGTDTLGRDMLSRLALAGQVSLSIGVAAGFIGTSAFRKWMAARRIPLSTRTATSDWAANCFEASFIL